MNKRVKRMWLKALRSGEYVQTKGKLLKIGKRFDMFCCLGVLCDLHALETGNGWDEELYLGSLSCLPIAVTEWAGIKDNRGSIGVDLEHGERDLMELNDEGTSFKKISKIIEEQF